MSAVGISVFCATPADQGRSSSDAEMYWPSKLWRGKAWTSTRLRGLGAWHSMEAVSISHALGLQQLIDIGVFGPAATKWYQFLQKKVVLSTNTRTTAARVLADQSVFATTNMALFLSSMSWLEGTSPKEKLKKNYISGLKANWVIWPPVQAMNFTVVPLEHRVLVVNVVSLGWNCFLSYLNSSK